MAASRFLAAAGVCVLLLSLAAENLKSYCSGCMKVATLVLWQQFVLHFGAADVLSKIPS